MHPPSPSVTTVETPILRPNSPSVASSSTALDLDEILEQRLQSLSSAMAAAGSIAVLLVDTSPLVEIESRFGIRAFRDTVGNVQRIVQKVAGDYLKQQDRIVPLNDQRDQIIVMFFRSRMEQNFYRNALPRIATQLREEILKRSTQIAYPYLRPAPMLGVGYGIAPYNASVRADKSLQTAVEQARHEADAATRQARLKEERELIHLIVAEEINSVFEPLVEIRTGSLLGYEALSRGPKGTSWESPAKLFRIAEGIDLLFELDCLCRRSALRNVAGKMPEGAALFLNCLPSAIRDPSFSGPQLARTLDVCGLDPQHVVLEISEQESIENQATFLEAIDFYRNLGIRIALDDVGSGYASMAAVLDIKPDVIKIDMTLIRSVDQDAARQELVNTLNHLARKIDAVVIAEGIETREEFETLQRIGIPYGQGYLFGRPCDIDHVAGPEEVRRIVFPESPKP